MRPKRILHCHSTFSLGGKEARAVRLMNVFGDAAEHVILSASPDAMGACDAIEAHVKVDFPGEAAPSLNGKPSPGRYRQLTQYMAGFDLVLTYNWGSMDAVGARRLFPKNCPPLIHHEDGFNADEAVKLNWKRSGFRRLMLPAAKAVVVVSNRLETIAKTIWKCPDSQIHRIPNGIDVDRYTKAPDPGLRDQLQLAPGDIIVGTLAGLRPVKNLPRLVRAIAAMPDNVKLVIAGEGSERQAIEAEASRLGIAHRVHLAGFCKPEDIVGHFDIFALSSDSEQFPISLIEAMAAGKPAICTDVGDVASIVPESGRSSVVPVDDEHGFQSALLRLVENPELREQLGSDNLAKARAEYGEAQMIARYADLYDISSP